MLKKLFIIFSICLAITLIYLGCSDSSTNTTNNDTGDGDGEPATVQEDNPPENTNIPATTCGDTECEGTETHENCAEDCAIGCGDNLCNNRETTNTCENDCAPVCEDDFCTHNETASSCPADCNASCGDAACTHEETYATCADDCVVSCGNEICESEENAFSCPNDCDASCGDSFCTHMENASTCPDDCNAICTDGACTHSESARSCPADCDPVCGDSACTHDETVEDCEADCRVIGENGFLHQTISALGLNRTVNFYAPASRGANPPLVIAFHGTGGNTTEWIANGDDPSGIQSQADLHGFVVAAPQSRAWTDRECSDWDNHGGDTTYWETMCPENPAKGSNPLTNPDLVLVTETISRAVDLYNIDPNRIYAVGFSNGGFFAVHVAMIFNNRIAAFAAGGSGVVNCEFTQTCRHTSDSTNWRTILSSAPESCTTSCVGPEKPFPVINAGDGRLVPGFLAHNNRDPYVSPYYTAYLASRMEALGYTFQVLIANADSHDFPGDFIIDMWPFLLAQSLP